MKLLSRRFKAIGAVLLALSATGLTAPMANASSEKETASTGLPLSSIFYYDFSSAIGDLLSVDSLSSSFSFTPSGALRNVGLRFYPPQKNEERLFNTSPAHTLGWTVLDDSTIRVLVAGGDSRCYGLQGKATVTDDTVTVSVVEGTRSPESGYCTADSHRYTIDVDVPGGIGLRSITVQ